MKKVCKDSIMSTIVDDYLQCKNLLLVCKDSIMSTIVDMEAVL